MIWLAVNVTLMTLGGLGATVGFFLDELDFQMWSLLVAFSGFVCLVIQALTALWLVVLS